MLAVFIFILAIVTLVAQGQPTELICFNPPELPADPVGIRSDPQFLQPLLERASELTVPQLEGLSIEEAAAAVPEILNNTAITMFKESLDTDPQLINPGDLTLVTLQSLLNTTNGIQIFNTAVQDPTMLVRAFTLIVQNFNQTCIDNPNILWLTLLTTMMSDILQPPFRDSFVNIINTTTVVIAQLSNTSNIFISVLEPMVENLDQAESVGGALGGLLSFVTDDAITVALSSALESSGFILQPEAVGEIFTAFFARISESFGIDGEEFVSFMNDIFKSILDALT